MKATSRVTIIDIARELNITAATVSRALNDHPSIRETTKQTVREAALKLNYEPNKLASSLRLGRSNIIGVIISSIDVSFFGTVVSGIQRIANERDYNVLIYQTNELYDFERKGVQTFLRSQVDGILASVSKETVNLDHYREIRRRGIPLVLFDRVSSELEVSSVEVNDYAGAFDATCHLINQGCQRIAHIAGQQHVNIFNQRLKGYIDALKRYAIPVDDDMIMYGKVSINSGRECMQHLLSRDLIPDGVVAVEDYTALGAMQAIKSAGKKIPEEVALIGFADEAFGQYLTPSLSTVDQQTLKMGEEAARMFFDQFGKKDIYSEQPKKCVLEPKLILRQSSLKSGDLSAFDRQNNFKG